MFPPHLLDGLLLNFRMLKTETFRDEFGCYSRVWLSSIGQWTATLGRLDSDRSLVSGLSWGECIFLIQIIFWLFN